MTMKFKCPSCETEMNLTEDAHVCPECEKSLTLDEATELFNDGDIVAVINEEDETNTDEDEGKTDVQEEKEIDLKVDLSEHIDALIEGEELSEDFQKKAATIFESAVNAKIAEITAVMEENQKIAVEKATAQVEADLSEQVNDYLEYVVKEWMEDNKVEIEANVRTEVTENFIAGMRDLFAENYIDVPEERYDVLEGLAAKVEELEGQLDEQTKANIELSKSVKEQDATAVLADVSEGLADTQKEKLAELAETIEFEDAESYKEKLNTLKESFISDSKEDLNEDVDDASQDDDKVLSPVDALAKAASAHLKVVD